MSTVPFDIATDRLITAHAVIDRLKISRAALRRLISSGKFPQSQSTAGAARWSEQTVNDWIKVNRRHPVTRRRGER